MFPVGETAALATSVSWTLCGLAFALAGRRVGSMAVNQVRILIAVVILVVIRAAIFGAPLPDGSSEQLTMLALSGIAGLALGDSFFFYCIAVLGPRLGAVLMATSPVMCALLAWPMLGESPDAQAVVGIAVTVIGVVTVVVEPGGEPTWVTQKPKRKGPAILCGLLGAFGQALGLVLSKMGMVGSGLEADAIDPFSATVVRMVAGAAGVVVIAALGRRLWRSVVAMRDRRALGATLVGVVFGPTLGVWLSMVAVRGTNAGVAAALMALPPVLMIPTARIAYGARPGRWAILGTVVAVSGTAVLMLRPAAL